MIDGPMRASHVDFNTGPPPFFAFAFGSWIHIDHLESDTGDDLCSFAQDDSSTAGSLRSVAVRDLDRARREKGSAIETRRARRVSQSRDDV
jgi:hypothetical protein